ATSPLHQTQALELTFSDPGHMQWSKGLQTTAGPRTGTLDSLGDCPHAAMLKSEQLNQCTGLPVWAFMQKVGRLRLHGHSRSRLFQIITQAFQRSLIVRPAALHLDP